MDPLHDNTTSLLYLVPFLLSAILYLIFAIFSFNPLSRTSHSNTASPASSSNTTNNAQTNQSKNNSGSKRSNKRNNRRKNNSKIMSPPTAPAKTASHSRDTKHPTSTHPPSPTSSIAETLVEDARVRQPFDAFLVVDFEATCVPGGGFDYPNEIIVRLSHYLNCQNGLI